MTSKWKLLMLGKPNDPRLLVEVRQDYDPTNFEFAVINGAWRGIFTNGYITILRCPGGEYTSLDKCEILTDNQDRLRGNYNEVFYNFKNPDYVVPSFKYNHEDFDDIPF